MRRQMRRDDHWSLQCGSSKVDRGRGRRGRTRALSSAPWAQPASSFASPPSLLGLEAASTAEPVSGGGLASVASTPASPPPSLLPLSAPSGAPGSPSLAPTSAASLVASSVASSTSPTSGETVASFLDPSNPSWSEPSDSAVESIAASCSEASRARRHRRSRSSTPTRALHTRRSVARTTGSRQSAPHVLQNLPRIESWPCDGPAAGTTLMPPGDFEDSGGANQSHAPDGEADATDDERDGRDVSVRACATSPSRSDC